MSDGSPMVRIVLSLVLAASAVLPVAPQSAALSSGSAAPVAGALGSAGAATTLPPVSAPGGGGTVAPMGLVDWLCSKWPSMPGC